MSVVAKSQAGRLYWSKNKEPNQVLEDLLHKILPILGFLPPWDFWLEYLTLSFKDGAGKKFSQVQRMGQRLSGFVIGKWNEKGELVEYLKFHSLIGEGFISFDDETAAMSPLMYKTLGGAMSMVEKIRKGKSGNVPPIPPEELTGLAFWSHPEIADEKLERYVRLSEGFHFPGSPRQ